MISLCTPTRFEAWLEKSGASKRFVDEKRYWLKTNGDQHGCNTALAHNGGLAGQWHEARTKSNAKAFANWTVGWLVSVDAALSIYTTLNSAIFFSFFVFFWYFLIVTLLNFDWLRLACVRLLMVAHTRRVQAEDRLANIFKSLLEIGGAQFVAPTDRKIPQYLFVDDMPGKGASLPQGWGPAISVRFITAFLSKGEKPKHTL